MAWGEVRTGRSLDRLLNFSDAVVAVAITILALPLVDIEGPGPGQTMRDVIAANFGQIQTFAVTFVVVALMWGVHNKIVNRLQAYDSAIFWLMIFWLMGFVFLPWPSRLYEGTRMASDGGQDIGGPGVLYWATLAFISLMGWLTTRHMNKHRDLIDPAQLPAWEVAMASRARFRSGAFTVVFVFAAFVTYFVPWLGNMCLLLLIPIGIWLKSPRDAEEQAIAGSAATDPGPTP